MNKSNQHHSTVAIAHTKEKHRSPERVLALVREAIDLLNRSPLTTHHSPLTGLSRYVKPGQTVLIKPNQTVFYSAEEGCTTDPLVVEALVNLAKEAGAARVMVAESSGGSFPSLKVMDITGVLAAAERAGAEVIDLKECPTQQALIPNGVVLDHVQVPAPLLEADVIINA